MVDQRELEREFFSQLERTDVAIAARVAAEGCVPCRGRLHRSDYPRKPRGALIAPEGEQFIKRISFCCSREGCRKRATPPSVRFLGRRVYLGIVVVVTCVLARWRQMADVKRATGVPVRTTRRWLGWWCGPFVTTEVFLNLCARLVGVAIERLPASIVERLPGSPTEQVSADGARFLRVVP
jgi:hypothetical protein